MSIKERTTKLLAELNKGIFEKEEIIKLSFLSTIAGESIFLLGKPGVAKSLIARRLKSAFADAESFEYLMNKFSTPDEIFGPVSISKLKDDKYERITDKYLPNADIAFLDEIWKAGPSIQNSLLTIINEKVYRNGEQEIKANLKGLIAASNELPEKGQGLEALWDRFIIRYLVKGIDTEDNFNSMLTEKLDFNEDDIDKSLRISEDDYKKWSEEIEDIIVPPEVLKVIDAIRKLVQEYNQSQDEDVQIYVSDRRWRKIAHILRASAYLNERESVDLMDCFLIAHCIWDEQGQIAPMQELVAKTLKEHGYSTAVTIKPIKDEIDEFETEVRRDTKIKKDKYENEYQEFNGYYKIEGLQQSIAYCLIKISDFETLNHTSQARKLYNNNSNVLNRYLMIKDGQLKIRNVHYSNSWNDCQIATHKVLRPEIQTVKPNPKLKRAWNRDTKRIKQQIEKEIKSIEDYREKNHSQLHNNLFVNSELASLIESNFHVSIQQLQQLQIELEKVKHSYDSIE